MLDETKNQRLMTLLQQTDKYLEEIGTKIGKHRAQVRLIRLNVPYDGVGQGSVTHGHLIKHLTLTLTLIDQGHSENWSGEIPNV